MPPVRLLIVCCALLAIALAPSAALAAYPGANGDVAFVSGNHIWVKTESALTDLTASTTAGVHETQPKFSPDGRKIAFVRQGGGLPSSEIFVMNPDGSGRTALTNTPLGNSDPTWSPDGTQIAFVSLRDKNAPQIWIMNADGTSAREVTTDNSFKAELAWSPKGDRIALVAAPPNSHREIYSITPAGAGLTQLTNDTVNDLDPAWSPDGTRIAYAGTLHPKGSVGGDLWTMNADGSNKQPFLHETNGYSDGAFPAWSPDGTQMAFGANNGSGYYHLWSAPAGGGENADLVANKIAGGNPVDQETDWQPRPGTTPAVASPSAGHSGSGSVVSGSVLVKTPGGKFRALSGTESIPVGSVIDATHGTVQLTVIGSGGAIQTGDFGGGVFLFQQKLQKKLLATLLTLQGGKFSACGASAASLDAGAARRRVIRYLNAEAHGRFAVIGKHSEGLERGTQWKTTDTCDGTLTAVQQGSVAVTDFTLRKTVIVKAGHSYLARAKAKRTKRRR